MRAVTSALHAATNCDHGAAPRGTDGCSIPTFAIPLRKLALAFARVVTGTASRQGTQPRRSACAVPSRAILSCRRQRRFDTKVMGGWASAFFCKSVPKRVLARAPARPWAWPSR